MSVHGVKPVFLQKKSAILLAHSNEKGGVGKTTVSFNQAYRLAEKGKRVLVVDIDGQRNMSKLLLGSFENVVWVENNGFTSPSLFEPNLSPEKITVYPSVVHENIFVIPAHKERIANVLSAGREAAQLVLNPRKYLVNLDFDFILIDTPPSLGLTQVAAIAAVDWLFIPVTVDDFSNEGMLSLLKTVSIVKKNTRSSVEIAGIYINLFKTPTKRTGENPYADILETLEKTYSKFLIKPYLPDSISIREARMKGKACWVTPPNGNAAVIGRTFRTGIDELNSRLGVAK
ncbi:ParA family protein [Shewanella xiamenensis]|uniref:ParA family protein n=1 Tax=Shewanella xiamenensis TaxID=332186 RepID=UPI0021C0E04D|nr:ParA family protein [Shewanella xiamenensis]MCT8873798.1 ParA family protein [Shewanella xiamenensis]